MPLGAENEASARSQIEAIVLTLVDSWNNHDMVTYASQFTDDADFVNVVGMHWHGRRQIEQMHIAVHNTIFRNSSLRSLGHSIRFLGEDDVALLHVNWEMSGQEPVPGLKFEGVRRGVLSGVLVQKDARWLITAFQNTDIVDVAVPGVGGPKPS